MLYDIHREDISPTIFYLQLKGVVKQMPFWRQSTPESELGEIDLEGTVTEHF